jgi:hypothetical protein
MATKYQQYIDLMLKQNKELFEKFRIIHDQYALNPTKNRDEFNTLGRDVQDVIRRTENLLCSKSESSGYSKYSTQLSEKFQAEIRKMFPKINSIGEG